MIKKKIKFSISLSTVHRACLSICCWFLSSLLCDYFRMSSGNPYREICMAATLLSPDGRIAKRFVKFLPIQSHSGESLCQSVLAVLQDTGTDISNCRGQCYNNSANMSGVYTGLQAHIKQFNPLVECIECTAHTLKLVLPWDRGIFVQTLFNFSSKSTSHW